MTTLRLVELSMPLRRPFANARRTIEQRRVVLVALKVGGVTGWGEAAPLPGVTGDTIDSIFEVVTSHWPDVLGAPLNDLPTSTRAAFDQAATDLSARVAGLPLWRMVGGRDRPVSTSAAVGIPETVEDLIETVGQLVDAGYVAIKLKVAPGRDGEQLATIRKQYPDLVVGVDGNAAYRPRDMALLVRLDALGPSYIEQPFPVDDIDAHVALRQEVEALVCLDEAIDSIDAVRRVAESEAADMVTLKPGRLGVAGCREAYDVATSGGMVVKISGLLETGVGRAYALALATLPGIIHADIALATTFFVADVVTPPWRIIDGGIAPPTGAGIGVAVDEAALQEFTVREVVLDG